MMNTDPAEIPFQDVIDNLLDESNFLKPAMLYRLSNLAETDLKQLSGCWEEIPLFRRRNLMADLETFGEADSLLFFEKIGTLGLDDSDPDVRICAIRVAAIEESPRLVPTLLKMLAGDPDLRVQAEAARMLGRYVYLGELEEIPQDLLGRIEEALLAVLQAKAEAVIQFRALESMGYSSRKEVSSQIETAFNRDDEDWQISALIAMGRSANPRWKREIMDMLENESALVRAQAAQSAGELELHEASHLLTEMLGDSESEVRAAAIWALSEVAPSGIRDLLEKILEESEDDSEIELIEDALENLSFKETFDSLPLFDFDEDDLENLREIEADDPGD